MAIIMAVMAVYASVSGLINVYFNELRNVHREFLELCSYHKILVKQMVGNLAKLKLGLFFLYVLLEHG